MLPSSQRPVDALGRSASGHQSLIGRWICWPIAFIAASFASMRDWFHFSHRSYSMLGLCGLVVASTSVGVTYPCRSSMSGANQRFMIETDAFVSDCDWVRKSRLRSKMLPFCRMPATRPSGFWIGLKMTIRWSRIRSTSASVPYGVSASFSISCIEASTPSNSFPWIPPWMKMGILKSRLFLRNDPIWLCAYVGSLSASSWMSCQLR